MTGSVTRIGRMASLAAAVTAVALVAALAAPGAEAARYKVDRPSLEVDITTKRNQVVEGVTFISGGLITCGGKNQGLGFGWTDVPFDRQGRLWDIKNRFFPWGDFMTHGIRARRQADRIVGSVFLRGRVRMSQSNKQYYCWSGRSWKDPWVRFVATRR